GEELSSWAVLGNGIYSQSASNGQILFSNIQAGNYNYWAYSGGYVTGQGSVSVAAGTTGISSICLNKATPVQVAPQTISVAVPGDDPPWQSSTHYESVVAPVGNDYVMIMILLGVLAVLIVVGITVNFTGRKNLMRIPEQM
ncbi:MAG: hypothetical protein V1944_00750, partial [Candidatus Aenigmatarchaeota archaeon]